jgi:hypothetical protein
VPVALCIATLISPFFVMGRRVYADDAEKDYAMAGIERLFIVSLRCEMKMKQAKVITTAVRCSSPLPILFAESV